MANLFSPTTIRNHKIKNRIVFPAMVVMDLTVPDAKVTPEYLAHYDWLSACGAGMIVTGAVCVNAKGKLHDNQLGIWADDFLEGLEKIPPLCHKNDTVIIMQIHHAGYRTVPSSSTSLVSSSDYEADGIVARALTVDEIHSLQQDFVNAAIRAEKAGFDGVELHGAHSYLISQFFSSRVNKRTDQYGGSPQNRARIATELIEAIRKATGPDFIVTCRMGCNDPNLEESIEIAKALEKAGADFLDVSYGNVPLPDVLAGKEPPVPEGFPFGGVTYSAGRIKKNVTIPVTTVFGIRTPKEANAIIENGYADFVDLLRAILVDPDWVQKAREGKEVILCLDCRPRCRWYEDRNKCPRLIQRTFSHLAGDAD